MGKLWWRKHFTVKNFLAILFIILCAFTIVTFAGWSDCPAKDTRVEHKPRYKLIVLVLSSPEGIRRRDAIRKTWLSPGKKPVSKLYSFKSLFVVGTANLPDDEKKTLASEERKHKDLLLLPNLRDSYDTLTKKVLRAFQRICSDFDFSYALKVDDDSWVVLTKLFKELETRETIGSSMRELYWGFFNGRAQVKRAGPWRETDWILCDYYLPYALGGGYVLSQGLVKFIADNANYLRLHKSEDVSVGLWLAPVANIERKHDVRFDTEYRSRGCSNEYIITHKVSLEKMQALHERYQLTGELCKREERHRMSYHYNWTVPPSQCCNRQPGIP